MFAHWLSCKRGRERGRREKKTARRKFPRHSPVSYFLQEAQTLLPLPHTLAPVKNQAFETVHIQVIAYSALKNRSNR